MAFSFGKKITQDGSVIYLDAANPNSYDGVSTNWNDLRANANGTLVNGPTYNSDIKSFTFDGVNDYVSFGNQSQFLIPTFTVSAWVSPLFFSDQGTAIFSLGDSNRLILGMNYGTAGVSTGGMYIYVGGNSAALNSMTSVPSVRLNGWYNYAFVIDVPGSNIKGYINGNQVYSNTNSYGTDLNPPGGYGGVLASRYGGSSDRTNMKIATFSFYNRALTAGEVAQNYDSLRGRFGL